MKRLLIVDDNDRYATLLHDHFGPKGYTIDRVYSAGEAQKTIQEKGISHYDMVVTDITMESQIAGIFLIRWLHREHYRGTMIVASTGFDVPPGMQLSKLIFGRYGVHYLIPKSTVRKGEFAFHSTRLFSRPRSDFQEATGSAK